MASYFTQWSSSSFASDEEDLRLGERYSREELAGSGGRLPRRTYRCQHGNAVRYCGSCRRGGL